MIDHMEELSRDVEMYKEWDNIINIYLSAVVDMNIHLDKKADQKSLEKIKEFDRAMTEFKLKYPEKFK